MLSRVSSGLVELPLQYDLCSQGVTRGDVVFGRNADSDVPLNHDSFPLLISRKHAVISLVGRGLCIKDTGSTNGTYVNEQRLQPQQTKQLSEDDVVSFGGSRLIVREGREHSNPFVYKLTGVSEVTNPVNATNLERRAANPDLVAVQSGEQAVDLTRTSSIEAAPLDVVDLTNSPDTQVCSRKQSHTNSTPFRIDSRMQTELWRSCPHRPQSRQLRESRLQHASRATVQHGNRPDSNAVRITEVIIFWLSCDQSWYAVLELFSLLRKVGSLLHMFHLLARLEAWSATFWLLLAYCALHCSHMQTLLLCKLILVLLELL